MGKGKFSPALVSLSLHGAREALPDPLGAGISHWELVAMSLNTSMELPFEITLSFMEGEFPGARHPWKGTSLKVRDMGWIQTKILFPQQSALAGRIKSCFPASLVLIQPHPRAQFHGHSGICQMSGQDLPAPTC